MFANGFEMHPGDGKEGNLTLVHSRLSSSLFCLLARVSPRLLKGRTNSAKLSFYLHLSSSEAQGKEQKKLFFFVDFHHQGPARVTNTICRKRILLNFIVVLGKMKAFFY